MKSPPEDTSGRWHRHPVLTNAAGSLLAAAILTGVAQIQGWINLADCWMFAKTTFAGFLLWLTYKTSVPNWLLIPLSFALLAWIAVLTIAAATRRRQAASRSFSPYDYTTDTFFGLRWRWCDSGPYDIVPFCSACDLQIDPVRSGSYLSVAPLRFYCKLCDSVLYEVGHGDTDLDDLQREVTLLIQRDVRRDWRRTPEAWIRLDTPIGAEVRSAKNINNKRLEP